MVMVALEFMFRHPYKLENLVNLMKEKARTLSVSSAPEGGQNFRWFVTHKNMVGRSYFSKWRMGLPAEP